MIMFIDREYELKKLEEITKTNRAELILVYGRRRVGKSRLLTEFAKKTDALYLLADLSENILDIFATQISKEFVRFNTWDDFFSYVHKSENSIIIIDEFQYLYQVNKAWPTILQRWWERLKETKKKIILCGSIISTIYKISMGYGSALYGRKTHELQITPLYFRYIKEFFPYYSFEQLVEIYAIVGGIPRYLEEFDSRKTVEENIRKNILEKTCFLYHEPMNLLFEEFRTPAPYSSILLALTEGYTRFAEIATVSKIQSYKLSTYLCVLERVGIVKKEMPVSEKKTRIKTTRYAISDSFYKFWYTFIFKNKSLIEMGMQEQVYQRIAKEFDAYVGRSFEEICYQFIIDTKRANYAKIGRWWDKEKEIDIMGINDNEMLLCECKWKKNVDAKEILFQLKEKIKSVDIKKKYIIFAKSFKEKFKESNVLLLDMKDMEKEWFH